MVKQLSDKAGTTTQSPEEKKEPLPTKSPKQEQEMTMDLEDLVQILTAGDGSATEGQKDTE